MVEGVAKQRIEDVAALGGAPLFSVIRPIGQLALPDQEKFFELAREIFARRRLTNNGPVVQELERELAKLHDVSECIAYANATIALIALIKIIGGSERGEVLLPAFTYAGLPHIVQWAGHIPRFCDIEEDTHALSPALVAAAIGSATRVILGVHQVNSPCYIDELTALGKKHNIPLIFDSVHGVGCTHRGKAIGGFGLAEVFSLHATKMLNGFEGGYITTNDARLAEALRRMRNFGIVHEGRIAELGLNGKLNEIHSAAALASIDGLDAVIERNLERYKAYRTAFASFTGLKILPYPENGEKWNYEFALLDVDERWPLSRNATVSLLRAENILVRAYYSPPLHQSPNRLSAPPVSLPTTEKLSGRFIQMAVGDKLSVADIQAIANFMRFLWDNASAIKARLATAEAGAR